MYMLLNVDKEENGLVSGSFIEWLCNYNLELAKIRAKLTEQSNSNRITVAVVDVPYNLDKYIYNNVKKEN